MRRAIAAARGIAAALGIAACGGQTHYAPKLVAPGELTLRYDGEMVIYAGRERLTTGPVYTGLDTYVRCVPRAREHARYARKHGRARLGLAWTGGGLGVASLGSLGGIALLDQNPTATFAILGAGLGVAVIGIVMAAASRSAGNRAHGNAVDALNYYNDAVGSLGGSCAEVGAPAAPPAPPEPPVAPPATTGDALEIEGPAPPPIVDASP